MAVFSLLHDEKASEKESRMKKEREGESFMVKENSTFCHHDSYSDMESLFM